MTYTYDQLEGTFLGLALGDAYGRPIEFDTDYEDYLEIDPTDEDHLPLRWTDDTHMSLYLSKALADAREQGGFHPDTLGHSIGNQLIEWLCDPLTPTTAPGNTCMRGTEKYSATRDWKTSGVKSSDGCGAVMRIAPLPFFFPEGGENLTRAAEIQAQITHAHPNALEAAIAGAHLLKTALDNHHLDIKDIEHAITQLQAGGDWYRGGDVAKSLQDVLSVLAAQSADEANTDGKLFWVDVADFHPGDGGWRSGSALAIALYSVLTNPLVTQVVCDISFYKLMQTATRHPGDSDSTGALAGMFFGAINGPLYLPREWIEQLDKTDLIYEAMDVIPNSLLDPKGPTTTLTKPGYIDGLVLMSRGREIRKGSKIVFYGTDGEQHFQVEGFFHGRSLMAVLKPLDRRHKTRQMTISSVLQNFWQVDNYHRSNREPLDDG